MKENKGVDPKKAFGQAKIATHAIPPAAILHLGKVMADGEAKYGRMNWRGTEILASVYFDAIMRHLLAWWDGEDLAPDSLRHHLAHIMGCCAVCLDSIELGKFSDDRPVEGPASRIINGPL